MIATQIKAVFKSKKNQIMKKNIIKKSIKQYRRKMTRKRTNRSCNIEANLVNGILHPKEKKNEISVSI